MVDIAPVLRYFREHERKFSLNAAAEGQPWQGVDPEGFDTRMVDAAASWIAGRSSESPEAVLDRLTQLVRTTGAANAAKNIANEIVSHLERPSEEGLIGEYIATEAPGKDGGVWEVMDFKPNLLGMGASKHVLRKYGSDGQGESVVLARIDRRGKDNQGVPYLVVPPGGEESAPAAMHRASQYIAARGSRDSERLRAWRARDITDKLRAIRPTVMEGESIRKIARSPALKGFGVGVGPLLALKHGTSARALGKALADDYVDGPGPGTADRAAQQQAYANAFTASEAGRKALGQRQGSSAKTRRKPRPSVTFAGGGRRRTRKARQSRGKRVVVRVRRVMRRTSKRQRRRRRKTRRSRRPSTCGYACSAYPVRETTAGRATAQCSGARRGRRGAGRRAQDA